MLLSDRVAIITGGAKGIGRGIALKFADEGCSVAVADIDMKEANNTVSEVTKKGRQGLAIQCDVTDGKQVKSTVDKVISTFGRIDILVNDAGALLSKSAIEDLSEEDWDKSMALNLKSDFLFCKYVVPHMKKRRYGRIINISSIGATYPPAHAISYNPAKAGVLGLTYDLAYALAPYNICVNAIMPGPVRTTFYGSRVSDDAFFAELGKKAVPLGRVGTPEDIAGAALFLASELSSFITGEELRVSGGIPLTPSPAPK